MVSIKEDKAGEMLLARLYSAILFSKPSYSLKESDEVTYKIRFPIIISGFSILCFSIFSFVHLFSLCLKVLVACNSVLPAFMSVKISNLIQHKIEMCH